MHHGTSVASMLQVYMYGFCFDNNINYVIVGMKNLIKWSAMQTQSTATHTVLNLRAPELSLIRETIVLMYVCMCVCL